MSKISLWLLLIATTIALSFTVIVNMKLYQMINNYEKMNTELLLIKRFTQ